MDRDTQTKGLAGAAHGRRRGVTKDTAFTRGLTAAQWALGSVNPDWAEPGTALCAHTSVQSLLTLGGSTLLIPAHFLRGN